VDTPDAIGSSELTLSPADTRAQTTASQARGVGSALCKIPQSGAACGSSSSASSRNFDPVGQSSKMFITSCLRRTGDTVFSGMEEAGYTCWPLVLDAASLGAPHRRQRSWILCRRNDPGHRFDFEAREAGQWPLTPECLVMLIAAQEIWDYWKRELAGPNGEFPDRVATPTATMILEPWWPGRRLWQTASGRLRKLTNDGVDSSMSWILEMAVRAMLQRNDNLWPTPETCEEHMGFPRGWTDLGTDGDEDAAWERGRRKNFGPRFWRERYRALGDSVVPQWAMLLGCFILEYESQAAAARDSSMHPTAALPAYVVSHVEAMESKEQSMSKNLQERQMSESELGQAVSMTGSAHAVASRPGQSGLNGEPRPQSADDALRPSKAGPEQPDSAVVAQSTSSSRTHINAEVDVVDEAEAYLRSYLSFPDDKYFLPLALFAALMHCWKAAFDVVPYLSVGAAVKSAGKTRVLELLSFLAGEERAILVDGSITPAALYTEIEAGHVILIDESEHLHNPRSPFRPILNGGYRSGSYVCRIIGGVIERFSNYGPKVFSHLGDLYDSLRDRCIVVHMQRTLGGGRKEYHRSIAQADGNAIGERMHEAISARVDEIKTAYLLYDELYPSLGFLRDRDKEIWKPLFSLCQVLAPSRVPELERSAIDIATLKTVPARPFGSLVQEEEEAEETEYAEWLLTDAISVMGDNEKMATSELVRRLRELPTSPWRAYRGGGITDDASGAIMMANLLKRFGVKPKTIRFRPKGEPNSTAKGYRWADIIAGSERAGVPRGGTGRNPGTPAAVAAEAACGPSEPPVEFHESAPQPEASGADNDRPVEGS
jgi:uncharacterized protein DUF3631/C-5 cytosine-specific DNA methylase